MFIYKQSIGDLTLAQFPKHVIIPHKWQVLQYKYSKTPHRRFQKKSEIVATQAPEEFYILHLAYTFFMLLRKLVILLTHAFSFFLYKATAP